MRDTTVYLCGPIMGCTDEECSNWREYAKSLLPAIATLDPMDRDYRGRETDPTLATEIVELDKTDIDASTHLIVMYDRPSVGTSMEILYAWERGKRVILVHAPDARLSPWLLYHSHHRVHSVADACAFIKAAQSVADATRP